MTTWITYILHCADDTLYTGVTTDLDRRLHEHNHCNKKGAKYTRVRRPVIVFHHEKRESRSDACKREAEIKKLSRQQKLALVQASAD